MSIVLPILFLVILIGLNARQMSPRLWGFMAVCISVVILYHLFKKP